MTYNLLIEYMFSGCPGVEHGCLVRRTAQDKVKIKPPYRACAPTTLIRSRAEQRGVALGTRVVSEFAGLSSLSPDPGANGRGTSKARDAAQSFSATFNGSSTPWRAQARSSIVPHRVQLDPEPVVLRNSPHARRRPSLLAWRQHFGSNHR